MDAAAEKPAEGYTPLPCIDAAGRVAAWVCCQKCRYNLFGLDAHGNCPECGTAILRSTVPSLARSLPPAWLDRVRHSAGLVRLAIGAGFLSLLVGVAATLWSKTLIWTVPVLLGLGLLSVVTAGVLLARADERSFPQRLRERRAEFTGTLLISPALVSLSIIVARLLLPPISALGRPLEISVLSILRVSIAGFLLSLAVYFAFRPIATFSRFLTELFENAWPMNSTRGSTVPDILDAARWFLIAAIALGLASGQIGVDSIARVAFGLAGFAALCGATALAAAIGILYWVLGDVRVALSDPISEARIREDREVPVDSA